MLYTGIGLVSVEMLQSFSNGAKLSAEDSEAVSVVNERHRISNAKPVPAVVKELPEPHIEDEEQMFPQANKLLGLASRRTFLCPKKTRIFCGLMRSLTRAILLVHV